MPYPTTIGGGLMGYPNTVDSGQISPLALYDGDASGYGSSTLTSTGVYLVAVTLYGTTTLTGVRTGFAAGGNGHYDTGIYDSSGTNNGPGVLLANAAATTTSLSTSTAFVSPAFRQGNLTLSPGRYWLAMWIDNGTDTVYRASAAGTAMVVAMTGTNAGPLPAAASSISSLADTNRKVFLIGLVANSWS